MKTALILVTTLICSSALAVNDAQVDLACFDVHSLVTEPTMTLTAHYNSRTPEGANIVDVRFPRDTEAYEYLPRVIRGIFGGQKIEKNRSPYKGNFDYDLMGRDQFGNTQLRLVLTADLSPNGLRSADVDKRGRGHAAVLIISSQVHKKWSGGDFYIRMTCRAR